MSLSARFPFFFWLPIYLSSDSCPRQGMCGCVGIPAALLSPLDGGSVFSHLSCLPGRSCRVSLGSLVPKAWARAFLAGWGALGVLPEAALCRGRPSKPLSPLFWACLPGVQLSGSACVLLLF